MKKTAAAKKKSSLLPPPLTTRRLSLNLLFLHQHSAGAFFDKPSGMEQGSNGVFIGVNAGLGVADQAFPEFRAIHIVETCMYMTKVRICTASRPVFQNMGRRKVEIGVANVDSVVVSGTN
jgi:hypothetical protein